MYIGKCEWVKKDGGGLLQIEWWEGKRYWSMPHLPTCCMALKPPWASWWASGPKRWARMSQGSFPAPKFKQCDLKRWPLWRSSGLWAKRRDQILLAITLIEEVRVVGGAVAEEVTEPDLWIGTIDVGEV